MHQVVIGYGISEKLSLGLFDLNNPFEVYVPKPGKGSIDLPEEAFNKDVLVPVGIYAISEELDSKYTITPVPNKETIKATTVMVTRIFRIKISY